MKRLFQISILFFICELSLFAQSPKREMRSAWLTTVWRIDWPSTTVPALGTESTKETARNKQKQELISILNALQGENANAVFFQIRSMCDAMYPSSYEPWSSFISSERGADPGYDPLAFAIEEAHKRGMELHAWINPYRYSSSSATYGNLSTDYVNTHPDWLLTYDSYTKILNPGKPEVVKRITDIVAEVVTNYDVDGIVFDDYFYVNGGTTDAMDQAQYDANNPDGLERGDWRRENCNKMIESVYNKIQELKPYVTFGVSPAGVAASSSDVANKYGVSPAPAGSDWQYNGIYSDPLAWVSRGILDYISPQIYWTTTSSSSYAKLAPWWSTVANKFGRHFYSSHSLSSMTDADSAPQYKDSITINGSPISSRSLSPIERSSILSKEKSTIQRSSKASNFTFSELGLQIDWNRNSDLNGAPGSVFYATTKAIGSQFVSYLNTNKFTQPSLTPAIGWKKAETQTLVENLTLSGQTLAWDYSQENVRYAVYAVPNTNSNDVAVFSSSHYLLGISYTKQFELPNSISTSTHKIAVSVFDRYGNEYSPRVMNESTVGSDVAKLVYPSDNSAVVIPTVFKWNAVNNADSYIWEVALDANFTDMVCARETTDTIFSSGLEPRIKENTTYYWRIRTRKANMIDSYSQAYSFNGNEFKITSPENGSTSISTTPTITWMDMGSTASYTIEISKSALFPATDEVFNQTVLQASFTIPDNVLISGTTYYARVSVSDNQIQATSGVIGFTTEELPIDIPVLLTPINESKISATAIEITWEEQNSKGFRAELSKDASFPIRSTTFKSVDAFVYSTIYENLDVGTYYLRVRAKNNDGLTEPSASTMVYLEGTSAIPQTNAFRDCYTYYDQAGNCSVFISSEKSASVSFSIYSVTGMLLKTDTYHLEMGKNIISLNLANYASGFYLLRIKIRNNEKIMKIKK